MGGIVVKKASLDGNSSLPVPNVLIDAYYRP